MTLGTYQQSIFTLSSTLSTTPALKTISLAVRMQGGKSQKKKILIIVRPALVDLFLSLCNGHTSLEQEYYFTSNV